MKYSVWKKERYSSDSKVAEFNEVEEAEKFAELLYKGNGKASQVYILGIVKNFPAVTEG